MKFISSKLAQTKTMSTSLYNQYRRFHPARLFKPSNPSRLGKSSAVTPKSGGISGAASSGQVATISTPRERTGQLTSLPPMYETKVEVTNSYTMTSRPCFPVLFNNHTSLAACCEGVDYFALLGLVSSHQMVQSAL